MRECVVAMDLDRFGEVVKLKGWSPYKPNIVTGTLTMLVEDFIKKWFATPVYGLDRERGTEEAVLEVVVDDPARLLPHLEEIRRRIWELGASITIVVVCNGRLGGEARSRREAYRGTPLRLRAHRLLKKAKRLGGNTIVMG